MGAASDTGEKGKRVMAGHLEEVDIFSVAQFLMLQQKTGTLELKSDDSNGKIFFEEGQVIAAEDGGGDTAEEAAFRLFQWKSGDFDFYATEEAASKEIQKDTQTLLFELAVRMDEESAEAAEEEEKPAAEAAAPAVAAPAAEKAEPVKAQAVKPGAAVARLVHRPGKAAAAGAPDISETQFMQAVQDRLELFVDELPETSGREWRQERAAAGVQEAPSRKIGILLSMITTAVLLAMVIIVVKRAKRRKNIENKPPVAGTPDVKEDIKLPPSYTFVTAPFTPEREAEDAIRKIAFKCGVNKVDVVGDKLEQGIVILQKQTHWERQELQDSAEHDAAHVINDLFNSPNCQTVQSIDVRVQAHVGLGEKLEKWTDVLIINASRTSHKKGVRLKNVGECSRFLRFFNVQTNYE